MRESIDNPEVRALQARVKDALCALPIHFSSRSAIEGLEAGDLFSLNSVLGGTIEIQVVDTLNRLREVWDPDGVWAEYGFQRSSQTFPDVRLVTKSFDKESPVLGIELKGWYLLSKEGTPSFRYEANREACATQDLLVVVPWHLTNVLSGVPRVYEPYIENARYAADYRNYYWKFQRGRKDGTEIDHPAVTPCPYPAPKTKISDKARKDSGGNFGRVARVKGLMQDYVEQSLAGRVAGIEARHWVAFFKAYSDGAKDDQVAAKVASLLARSSHQDSDDAAHTVVEKLNEIRQLML